jgi:hypothetical protein
MIGLARHLTCIIKLAIRFNQTTWITELAPHIIKEGLVLAFGMELLDNRTTRQVAGVSFDIDGASNITTSTNSVLAGLGECVLNQLAQPLTTFLVRCSHLVAVHSGSLTVRSSQSSRSFNVDLTTLLFDRQKKRGERVSFEL